MPKANKRGRKEKEELDKTGPYVRINSKKTASILSLNKQDFCPAIGEQRIVLHVSEYSIYQGNQSRNYKVPKDVVRSQIESLEWIEDSEAHRIAFINQDGYLDFRGTCNSYSFSYG